MIRTMDCMWSYLQALSRPRLEFPKHERSESAPAAKRRESSIKRRTERKLEQKTKTRRDSGYKD